MKIGDSSFFGLGIPMFHGEGAFTDAELKATANATLGWWHHSIENRLDKMDWTLMQEHIRVYAGYLWELATAPVLPFRFVPVAEQVIGRLEEFKGPGSAVGLDGAPGARKAVRGGRGAHRQRSGAWRPRNSRADAARSRPHCC